MLRTRWGKPHRKKCSMRSPKHACMPRSPASPRVCWRPRALPWRAATWTRLKEIQAARARQLAQKNTPRPADKPPQSFSAMKPYNQPQDPVTGEATAAANTETARKMLKDARQALRAGDLALARELCDKARSLKPELNWWEDTPDKIVTEIRQVESSAAPGKSPYASAYTPADPRAALKQARDLYTAGKIEEAERLAQQANTGKVR